MNRIDDEENRSIYTHFRLLSVPQMDSCVILYYTFSRQIKSAYTQKH